MKQLLKKINIIDFKYGKLEDKNQFNLFTILRKGYDERYLHSKFIYELLNEVGPNEYYKRFLIEFLKIIGVENFSLKNYVANTEYENIDLFFYNDTQAIIIENKIYAGDEDDQLQRYYDKIKKEGWEEIFIFYLTLNEKNPSDYSVGNLDRKQIKLISYRSHITKWIEKCIEIASTNPALRESLIQYLKLINNLTGNSMEQKKEKEIIELLSENDNIISAYTIVENWNVIKFQIEINFWKNLEKKISINYLIMDAQKYSEAKISKLIEAKKNKDPWYGIMFKIATFKKMDVCLFIEKGYDNMYYGITILYDGKREYTNDEDFTLFSEKIVKIKNSWIREPLWLGGLHFEPTIDFTSFYDENTLKLVKDDFRNEIILSFVEQIDIYIQKVLKIIEELK